MKIYIGERISVQHIEPDICTCSERTWKTLPWSQFDFFPMRSSELLRYWNKTLVTFEALLAPMRPVRFESSWCSSPLDLPPPLPCRNPGWRDEQCWQRKNSQCSSLSPWLWSGSPSEHSDVWDPRCRWCDFHSSVAWRRCTRWLSSESALGCTCLPVENNWFWETLLTTITLSRTTWRVGMASFSPLKLSLMWSLLFLSSSLWWALFPLLDSWDGKPRTSSSF